MIEVLLLLALVMLAKHPKRRGRYNLRLIRLTGARALSTLASQTGIATALTGAATDTYRVVSMHNSWSVDGLTAGEGPLTVGYAYSDYTVAEIKEFLDSQAALNIGSKIEQEQSRRLIRVVGTFSGEANQSLFDGKPIRTKLNWKIAIGDTVQMFVFNEDASSALTTGASVHCIGKMYIKDGG